MVIFNLWVIEEKSMGAVKASLFTLHDSKFYSLFVLGLISIHC